MAEPRTSTAAGLLAAFLLAAFLLAAAPASAAPPAAEIPEDALLDVGIRLFGDGLPADAEEYYDLREEGIYPEVRKAEARYMPVRLMETLQASGQWGAVRIVPRTALADLLVDGTVVESSGLELVVEIRAVDVSGKLWLAKRYKAEADPRAYRDDQEAALRPEPFQGLFDAIAADLLARRRKVDVEEARALRRVTTLRFAADVVPPAFAGYLERNRKGRAVAVGMPADDDPMLLRLGPIRDRDDLFVDTLTEHYVNFRARMEESYDSWRKYSYEEELARRKLKRQALGRKILGAVAIAGGVIANDGSRGGSAVSDAAVIGGMIAIQSGINKGREAKLHVESIQELAASFDAEIAPALVEVEGHVLRLTGSVDDQYAEWRRLLREIFAVETGLPLDPNDGGVVAAPPANAGR